MIEVSKAVDSNAERKSSHILHIVRKQTLSNISEEASENIDDSKNDDERQNRSDSIAGSKKQMCGDVSENYFKDQLCSFAKINEKRTTVRFVPEDLGYNKPSIL